jgi:hypothetical protein
MLPPPISKEKPSGYDGFWSAIGMLLVIGLSAVYDLVVIVFAFKAAHDNFSRSDITDHSVESALTVLFVGMFFQVIVGIALYANGRGRWGGAVLFGTLPLVVVAVLAFAML